MTTDFPHPDLEAQATENPEFSAAWSELKDLTGRYRERVLAAVETSPEGKAALRRNLVKWVEDDVAEDFRANGLRSRLRSLAATWRELLGRSTAFRFASQGALALGLGLLLGLFLDISGTRAARAEKLEVREQVLPAPSLAPDVAEPRPADAVGDEVRRSRDRLPTDELAKPLRGK